MKKIITLAAFLLTGLAALAQPAMPFMRIDRNPVTAAMGGAESVSPLYNPGVLPFASSSNVVASYQLWAPRTVGSNHFNLLAGIKLGEKLGLTATGAYQMGKPYTIMDASGAPGGTFSPNEMMAGLGIGFRFTESLGIGATVRFASEKLTAKNSYSTIAGDLLLVYRTNGLTLTGGIASLGTGVADEIAGSNNHLPPTSVRIGAGYHYDLGEGIINAAVDADYYLAGGLGGALGAEYGYKEMVFVRAGAHLGGQAAPIPTYVSLGAGVKFSGVHLDISFLTLNEIIGNTLTAGIGYEF